MTLSDYLELAAYWKKHPPIHLLIQAIVGYNSRYEPRTEGLTSLLAAAGPRGMLRG